MRGKGITFDTGFLSAGTSTREPFDPEVVRREMRVIRDNLHCNAVRVTGGDPDRLKIAATRAADAGLEVWLCPFTNGLTQGELLTGSELSLFTVGFLPGETLEERLTLVADPLRVCPMIGEVRARINDFLRRAVDVVRARFGGKVSYASLPLEGVDGALFDIISTDAAYRTAATAAHFLENIRAFVAQGRAQGKPVAITEFGCTTHRGAADGGGDLDFVVWSDDGRPARLNGEYVRDEEEQATYLREVLEVFEAEGVDNAFVTPSRATTCRTGATRARTSTWRASAWSRCSTARAVHAPSGTQTCHGSPRSHSPPWRTSTAADPSETQLRPWQ